MEGKLTLSTIVKGSNPPPRSVKVKGAPDITRVIADCI